MCFWSLLSQAPKSTTEADEDEEEEEDEDEEEEDDAEGICVWGCCWLKHSRFLTFHPHVRSSPQPPSIEGV